MILQVHDELVLDCPPGEVGRAAQVIQEAMENAYSLNIPLLTEARAGPNWGEMKML